MQLNIYLSLFFFYLRRGEYANGIGLLIVQTHGAKKIQKGFLFFQQNVTRPVEN